MRAVNLIPADARRAGPGVQSGGLGPGFAVLGLLGVALLLVTIYVLTSNTISDRKVKLSALQTEVTQEQAVANQLAPYATYTRLAQTRAATITQIAQSRFNWHDALADLSRVVPANTSLNSLLATVAPGSSASGGGSGGGNTGALRGDISAPALQISGCTASHDDVARLMSRLRLINGVQRVTLSDSVNGSGGATTVTSGSSSGGGCTPRQTDFDLVVFFQPLAGAAAAGGGAAPVSTAPGGPTPAVTPATASATAASPSPTGQAQQVASSSTTASAGAPR